MISILPGGFASVVEADWSAIAHDPVRVGVSLFELLFLIDVQIGTVGYLLTLRPLDAHIRSGNPLLAGWVAALMCYPPFVFAFMGRGGVIQYEYQTEGWGFWLTGHPAVLWAWAGALVLLTACYAWATVAFGIRFSNLTYRGVLTNGPYRFTRHPAYLSKNLFWWGSAMPFLVTNGSLLEAVRNTLFLGLVSGIYFWRAKTEEAHLLAEDPKYRAYHAWMQQHGAITAPLAKLMGRARPRQPVMQPAE
jgi:protein-S-isoprenylcysteine O-methyltransferase Ste14